MQSIHIKKKHPSFAFPLKSSHKLICTLSSMYKQNNVLSAYHLNTTSASFTILVFVHCCDAALSWPCQTQTPPQRRKTRARCAGRDVWPPPRPTRATATQPLSTGLTVSSRARPPHPPRHPPHPTREGDLLPPPTPLPTLPSTPTPQLPHWQISWHTPS